MYINSPVSPVVTQTILHISSLFRFLFVLNSRKERNKSRSWFFSYRRCFPIIHQEFLLHKTQSMWEISQQIAQHNTIVRPHVGLLDRATIRGGKSHTALLKLLQTKTETLKNGKRKSTKLTKWEFSFASCTCCTCGSATTFVSWSEVMSRLLLGSSGRSLCVTK